ncbi:hypothetical protein EIP91_001022 [Steccherinum ochraceum]|uniref:F-box domain-containing protein n=1 Tax=Steccherinum ochraceum TaxID=92696 RepID=A0A4R0RNA9_9APHY|nr:hypothetical protein EIP91_001022 [Steccherinum ochraceum]
MVQATIPAQVLHLPSEIYGDIVDHIQDDTVQQDILALTRAFPRAPIPIERLFRDIRLSHREQIVPFYTRIRRDELARGWVRTFSLETWQADADVVINILALFPRLRVLKMFMGPNFAPDHLEELFTRTREGLEYLSLRFRPYVQRATYYQFLAGAYFDSLLFALAKWPASSIPRLSIVQDPLDQSIAPVGKFAQPFVFHRLDPFSTLSCAPSLATMAYFRLRIPSRQISRFIHQPQRSLPSLTFLDLSTCDVRFLDVEAILGRFSKLDHLILDQCNLITQRELPEGGLESQWATLGKTMALSGVKLMKDREKKLRIWIEATATSDDPQSNESSPGTTSKGKKGRRGLATATISLRQMTEVKQAPAFATGAKTAKELGLKPDSKIRVLPPKPRLQSIAVSLPPHANTEQLGPADIRAEFELGWAQGIAQLMSIRTRLKTSWYNGTAKVVSFENLGSEGDGEDTEDGDREYGLSGLKYVENEETFALGMDVDRCPILCLAGSWTPSEGHTANCGHDIGREIWTDNL